MIPVLWVGEEKQHHIHSWQTSRGGPRCVNLPCLPALARSGAKGLGFGRLHSSWHAGQPGLSIATCNIIFSPSSVLGAENHYLAQLLPFTKARSKSGSALIGKLKSYLFFKHWLLAQGCQHFTSQPN